MKFIALVSVKKYLKFLLLLSCLFPLAVFAQSTPHAIVKQAAGNLVSELTKDPEKLKNNPDAYQKIVREILVPVVNFEEIAKRVMGKTHYLAASEAQRKQFAEVFRESLIVTYSTGLEIFDNQEIKVLDPNPADAEQSVQSIDMEVKTSDGTIFPLRFTLQKNEAAEWKVVNVVLNGVNVGKAYRNHFVESATKYADNIDQIIANWDAKIAEEEKIVNK